ncbi:MAG TPA: PVC-type heme-binding CxxCH protein [Planctomycetota bacterium]|nr:PVC-type heme-binding CxxCH protein [Planctomycetota bacterium]
MPRWLSLLKCLLTICLVSTLSVHAADVSAGGSPEPENDAEVFMKAYRLADGLKIELFAAEPHLQHPVAICTDEKGRFFVAESNRLPVITPTGKQDTGDLDMRSYMHFLDEDIACRTVEDRINMLKRNLGEKAKAFEVVSERVKMLFDKNGDGKIDASTTFAECFNKMEDGLAAGVLARKGNVYFTDIPNVWLLKDKDDDGKADETTILSTGYGVRIAYLGHDLHGLIIGPDGKLYFSIGDRGFHVKTREGKTLAEAHNGAVFRCNQDGSDLEVIAVGMRNPQELAFNALGDLYTGDNNCDKGDPCRWVWVLDGVDCGWRIGYQHIFWPNLTGPWHGEKLWSTAFDGQAAYVVPPLGHVCLGGPSGLAYYPGTGMPERYNDHFFICDFRGTKGSVISFAMKPKGASYELTDQSDFIADIQATDIMFGNDGRAYTSVWYGPILKTEKGRIYAISDPALKDDASIAETKKLIAKNLDEEPVAELKKLLAHRDMRVRQEAQFSLVAKNATGELANVVKEGTQQLARLHAIWGLGQLFREKKIEAALEPVLAALSDPDGEVRTQAAKVLGECRYAKAQDGLVNLLKTGTPRAKLFATMALGRLGDVKSLGPVTQMLRENADKDMYLRHAGIMALKWIAEKDMQSVLALSNDTSPAVRIAVCVALRKLESPEIARFLKDSEPRIVLEAARAINDIPITAALPKLAAIIESETWKELSPGELFAIERFSEQKEAAKTEAKPADAKPAEAKTADAKAPAAPAKAPEAAPAKAAATGDAKKNEKPAPPKRFGRLVKAAEHYAERPSDNKNVKISGHLPILMSGPYSFWIAGSDVSELWLSTDEKPENKRLICQTRERVDPQNWTKDPAQQSYPVTLTAGKRYYVEAILRKTEKVQQTLKAESKDAEVKDAKAAADVKTDEKKIDTREHLSFGWQLPNNRMQRPITDTGVDDQSGLLRRIINANFRVGGKDEAYALASLADNPDYPSQTRAEALLHLSNWGNPSQKDAVTNCWVPLPKRDPSVAASAIRPMIRRLIQDKNGDVQVAATQLVGKLGIGMAGGDLYEISTDEKRPLWLRIEAVKALGAMKHGTLLAAVRNGLESKHSRLRQECLNQLAALNPDVALPLISNTLERPDIPEKQNALAILAKMKVPTADALIADWMDRLMAKAVDPEIQLDILEAAKASTDPTMKNLIAKYNASLPVGDELAPFRVALHGGNADLGRRIFYENSAAQCIRCHKINGNGGDVGPDLKGIGTARDRAYLLESIISPSAQIAQGFETAFVKLNDGRVFTGTVKNEDEVELELVGADGKVEKLKKDQIRTRKSQKTSTMPAMGETLSKTDLRNLVEFLAGLK